MDNILYINACCRENSRTNELAQHLIGKLNGEVQTVNLYEENLRAVDTKALLKREALAKDGKTDDESLSLAKQFSQADTVVIAAPYWDLMFPAVVKLYFESVTVSGLTFVYGENGNYSAEMLKIYGPYKEGHI